jgi:hypothetical protein
VGSMCISDEMTQDHMMTLDYETHRRHWRGGEMAIHLERQRDRQLPTLLYDRGCMAYLALPTHTRASEIQHYGITQIAEWMPLNQTAPTIQTTIITHLTQWSNNNQPFSAIPNLPKDTHRALHNQDEIGWDNFFEEKLTNDWEQIQTAYYTWCYSCKSGCHWTTATLIQNSETLHGIYGNTILMSYMQRRCSDSTQHDGSRSQNPDSMPQGPPQLVLTGSSTLPHPLGRYSFCLHPVPTKMAPVR